MKRKMWLGGFLSGIVVILSIIVIIQPKLSANADQANERSSWEISSKQFINQEEAAENFNFTKGARHQMMRAENRNSAEIRRNTLNSEVEQLEENKTVNQNEEWTCPYGHDHTNGNYLDGCNGIGQGQHHMNNEGQGRHHMGSQGRGCQNGQSRWVQE